MKTSTNGLSYYNKEQQRRERSNFSPTKCQFRQVRRLSSTNKRHLISSVSLTGEYFESINKRKCLHSSPLQLSELRTRLFQLKVICEEADSLPSVHTCATELKTEACNRVGSWMSQLWPPKGRIMTSFPNECTATSMKRREYRLGGKLRTWRNDCSTRGSFFSGFSSRINGRLWYICPINR